MFWGAIEGRQLALIEKRLKSTVKPTGRRGHVHRPGFYRHGALVRLGTCDKVRTYIAAGEGALSSCRFFPLDGNAETIREGNEAARIMIGCVDDAVAYLRFFCSILRTEGGTSFNIVDALPPDWATDTCFHVDVLPLTAWAAERAGYFGARGFVEHAGDLFLAEFAIRADGLVAMLEDRPLEHLIRMKSN